MFQEEYIKKLPVANTPDTYPQLIARFSLLA
jgi:hypothetical protein